MTETADSGDGPGTRAEPPTATPSAAATDTKSRRRRFRLGWLGFLQLGTTLIAVGSLYYAAQQVSEHAAPHLDAYAFFLRTPVPDVISASLINAPPDSIAKYEIIFNGMRAQAGLLQGSTGVWHVTVQNNGDGVATNVRIEAPGRIYSQVRSYGAEQDVSPTGPLVIDRLSPGGRISAFLWVRAPYYMDELCVPNRSEPGCFTTDDLSVFADDAGAHITVAPFTPPETADHRVRWWERRLVWLMVVLALVLLWGFFGPRSGRESE